MGSNFFVIGNGENRKGFNWDLIKPEDVVFGCNALYREDNEKVNLIVALDNDIVNEILQSKYCKAVACRTRTKNNNRRLSLMMGGSVRKWHKDRGWSAGPTALYLLFENNKRKAHTARVFLIGFLSGVDNKYIDNIYKNTECYAKDTDNAIVQDAWMEDLKTVFNENSMVQFYRVSESIDEKPASWKDVKNIHFIDFKQMEQML